MLTIFTTPKPFSGHDKVTQTNAIRSWLRLRPECQVILIGNEAGAAGVASELGIAHIPEVECNEYGTPLISSIFNLAQSAARYQLMCYVNADIILMSDFLPAVESVRKRPFLMIGQRWDLDLDETVNFDDTQWESRLQARLAKNGKLHPRSGIDYFVYSHGLYDNVPPFAIGRGGWDNWLVYQARRLKVPVIDATQVVTAVHQNHGYSHIPNGETVVWKGAEAVMNRELAGRGEHVLTLEHATRRLTPQGIKQALTLRDLYFRLEVAPLLYSHLRFLRRPMKTLTRLIIYIRSMLGMTQN
ncbi:MAG: hypothetical protein HYY80_05825 [Chloroflexi bacterium]|nr:hypothetical protein [Chloroflexota bacterium]MBI3930975.1 hypothetical protein [Chloroflexota bacterium]